MHRILATFLALALLAPSANAGFLDAMSQYKKGNIKIGQAQLHPWYGISESYDSNIFLVPKDEPNGVRVGGGVRSAWITRNDLGLGFKLPVTGMHSFDGGAGFSAVNYSKLSRINDYEELKANLGYNYKGPMGLSGRLFDSYLNTADPAFSELAGQRSQRWQNTLGANLGYAPEGGRLVGGTSFDHTTHKYLDGVTLGPILNRYEQTFGLSGGYMVAPKTKVYLGWRRQIIHYTANAAAGDAKNNKSHMFDVGVSGQLAPKVKGKVETGVQLRKYDQANANRTAYTRNWIVASNVTWNPRETCEFGLGLSRALQESTFGTNRFYISNNATLTAKHKFPYKLTARVKLQAMIDKYPESTTFTTTNTANRRDDTWSQGLGVDYDVQEWIKLGLDYDHTERNSIHSGAFNYERHLTTLSARLMF